MFQGRSAQMLIRVALQLFHLGNMLAQPLKVADAAVFDPRIVELSSSD
jgi:hypothetical protein